MSGFFNLDYTGREPTAEDLREIDEDPEAQRILAMTNEEALAELAGVGISPEVVYASARKALEQFDRII